MQALSQLSYSPAVLRESHSIAGGRVLRAARSARIGPCDEETSGGSRPRGGAGGGAGRVWWLERVVGGGGPDRGLAGRLAGRGGEGPLRGAGAVRQPGGRPGRFLPGGRRPVDLPAPGGRGPEHHRRPHL